METGALASPIIFATYASPLTRTRPPAARRRTYCPRRHSRLRRLAWRHRLARACGSPACRLVAPAVPFADLPSGDASPAHAPTAVPGLLSIPKPPEGLL